ncbi:MAG: PAS domain S-box protein [Promethearchaeota archaeon]|nr:MAG: PAS domain S-box protein [Candidatus Lokiarchaeota archaeon]
MEFSTDKFIQVIESIKECYFEVDLEGTFTFFNESLCKLTEYTREELLGLNYKYITDEENRKKVFEGFNTVYRTGEPLSDFEYQFRKKNGEKIIGETSVYLKYDSKGNKVGFYGIFRDVTKRREEEQRFKKELEQIVNLRTKKLRESEEKYSSLFHHSNDAIFLYDLDGNIIDINQQVLDQFGYSRSEILKLKIPDLHPISELETSRKAFEEITKKGVIRFEVSFKKKNGKIFLAEVASSLIDVGGKKVIQGIVRDITVRILTEKMLKDSEEKYRNMINHLDLGFYQLNWDGLLLSHNPRFCEILGYDSSENLKNKDVHNFWQRPEERKIYLKQLEKEGYVKNYLVHAKKKNGEKIVVQLNSHIIEGFKEKSLIIQGLISDITEKFELEQKLKKSEKKYRALFENSPNMIVLLNLEGEIIDLNPEILKFYGYEKEDFLMKNFRALSTFPPENLPKLINVFKKVINKQDIEPIELQFYNKDGNITWVSLQANLVEIENEAYIQTIIQDINKRKRAELKLKESEERYRNLIETVPFSIALIDQQGKIVYCNPAIEKLLGYNQDELIGHKFKNLPAINPNYIPITLKRFQKVLKGEILPPLEIELYKKDGSLIWIRYQTSLVKLGNDVLMQAVINDITEQKKADLLIEEEILKLKELDQIRKDLISRVSHELKTPLVSICGASELLLDSFIEEFKDDTKELIEMIDKGGKRLKYLVDNLVDIIRIEYKKFELKKDMNDINQLIRDCLKEMMYIIKKRELNLELKLLDGLFLEIDKIRIEQVLLNLLSNSIKNTPPNGKITVKSLKKNNYVEISITDTGIGLTNEEMDKLFTRFGKIERYGNGLEYIDIQGTGLGLYISKEIIDLHEGQIWAESEGRDKGSIFTIKLPAK